MNTRLKATIGLATLAFAACASAQGQITFYESEGFRGRAFATSRPVDDFARVGFNDRAASVVVDSGRWEACEDARFGGRCVVLRQGSYDSLNGLGMENRISSVRPAQDDRTYSNSPEPLAAPTYDYRRIPNERLYNVPVTSSRAVVATPERRCWVERQQVATAQPEQSRGNSIGGTIVGGLLGGILGHQIGGGTGNTVATIGGAVAGGMAGNAVGGRVGANNQTSTTTRDVQRCDSPVANATPEYWDVTYKFQGSEHHAQMSTRPGRTITVNRNGEPRM